MLQGTFRFRFLGVLFAWRVLIDEQFLIRLGSFDLLDPLYLFRFLLTR